MSSYAGKRRAKKSARRASRHQMMAAFVAFLDGYWPLWRQHEGDVHYQALKAAFAAGWNAA